MNRACRGSKNWKAEWTAEVMVTNWQAEQSPGTTELASYFCSLPFENKEPVDLTNPAKIVNNPEVKDNAHNNGKQK